MTVEELNHIEENSLTPMTKYSARDEHNKLLSQWEKDANGEWQDVTSIRKAEEHYIEIARRAGIPESQIQQAINEARARRENNTK